MNIFLISNMYPSINDPLFGVFVKNFREELETQGVLFSHTAVIKGKSKSLFKKIIKYLEHYSRILWFFFKSNDLLYIHYISHHVIIFFLLIPFKKKPWVFNAHGKDVIDLQNNSILNFFARRVLKKADLIVVPTIYFQEKILTNYSFLNSDKVYISPSGGINPERFYLKTIKSDKTLTLGFVSRFVEEKGWKTFLDALIALKNKGIPFKAIIAGKGPDEKKIINYIDDQDLTEYVNFLGLVPQQKLVDVYNSLDLFIFPTYREAESLGLTGLEAMACGTPVIACNIAGPSTYINDQCNGFLFKPKHTDELVKRILTFTKFSPVKKQELINSAIETAKNYHQANVAASLLIRLKQL